MKDKDLATRVRLTVVQAYYLDRIPAEGVVCSGPGLKALQALIGTAVVERDGKFFRIPNVKADRFGPFGDIYARRVEQAGGGITGLECVLCGKQTKEGKRRMVAINHCFGEFAKHDDPPDDVSGFPVGPECVKYCPEVALKWDQKPDP